MTLSAYSSLPLSNLLTLVLLSAFSHLFRNALSLFLLTNHMKPSKIDPSYAYLQRNDYLSKWKDWKP
jgi:hypothetical protein